MESVNITYRITPENGATEAFDFKLDAETFDLISEDITDPPAWTELEFRQCSHCPLDSSEHTHCPLALQLFCIVDRFHDTKSIDEVEMEVITEERRVIQKTAIQRVIASMCGLVFPICGCPKTEYMKPLARFHLPLASEEETVFNVTGMYLLAQYFLHTSSREAKIELEGLTTIYDDMHVLNKAVASRLQTATRSDSTKNAVTLLDMYSTLIPMLVEDELAEMRGFFKAYLPEGEAEVASTNYLEKAKAFSLELVPIEDEIEESVVGNDTEDDRPSWLKEVRAEQEPVQAAPEEDTVEEIAEEESSEFSIEFESVDLKSDDSLQLETDSEEKDEKEPSLQEPTEAVKEESSSFQLTLEGDDEPKEEKFGKAVFKLPDD